MNAGCALGAEKFHRRRFGVRDAGQRTTPGFVQFEKITFPTATAGSVGKKRVTAPRSAVTNATVKQLGRQGEGEWHKCEFRLLSNAAPHITHVLARLGVAKN